MEPGDTFRNFMPVPTFLVPRLWGQEFQVINNIRGILRKSFPRKTTKYFRRERTTFYYAGWELGIKEEGWPPKGQGTWIHLSQNKENTFTVPIEPITTFCSIYLCEERLGWGAQERSMHFQNFMPSANQSSGFHWCTTYF